MGDYLSPKRRDVVERLRRRIDGYRRHHLTGFDRFGRAIRGHYDQQSQETLILQQRYQEAKNKKAAKQSKTNKETTSQGDQRNQIVTQKLKRKLDRDAENSSGADGVFNYDEHDSPRQPTKHNCTGTSVSVQVTHEKNTINVTVNSTHQNPCFTSDSPNPGGSQSTTNIHTSVECKKEPTEDGQCGKGCSDPSGLSASLDASQDQSLEDLSAILSDLPDSHKPFTTEDLGSHPVVNEELEKQLLYFEQVCENVRKDNGGNPRNMYSTVVSCSQGLPKASFPDSLSHVGSMPPMYDADQNMNSVMAPSIPNMHGPSPHLSSMSEATGPAAETLKQLAAQHQQGSSGYGIKTPPLDPFSDSLVDPSFSRRNGYPNYPTHSFGGPSTSQTVPSYAYGQQSRMGEGQGAYPPHMQAKDLNALTYGATKPLTHYPGEAGQTPSSLQQLQNQVQTTFNPPTMQGMQVTHTHNMQVTQGVHRMQLSSSQQLQMQQNPDQISLSHQHSLSLPTHMRRGGQSPGMMSNQHSMQLLQEKLRQQQQQQHQQQQQQQQPQQQQQQPQSQGQMAPQFARPPPEYKMQPRTTTPGSFPNGGAGPNPLQTMQNMVNQTTNFGNVKTEVVPGQAPNGMMQQATHMAAVQSMSASVTGSGVQQSMAQAGRVGYAAAQPMQRPPAYPPSTMTSAVPGTTSRAPTSSTYTSAIMRNQRPPNVNVGPEGLNISQPRNPDWQRPMMAGHTGPRPPIPATAMSQPTMSVSAASAASMMQYGQFVNGNPGGNPMQQRSPHMNSMAPQAGMMQNGSQQQQQQLMMQQTLQITQQQRILAAQAQQRGVVPSSQSPGYPPSMGPTPTQGPPFPPSSMPSPGPQGMSYPQQSSTPGHDDLLHNLDWQNPANSFQFVDDVNLAAGSTADFFDDILK